MSDNEIIAKYRQYEPFFQNWYIRRLIGEGGFGKVFEIVRTEFGNEYTSAMKIITISKTKNEIEAMKLEGMSESNIRESLQEIMRNTVREIELMYKLKGHNNIVHYEDHAIREHEDGSGWDIMIKMELLTSLGDYIQNHDGKISKRDVIRLGIDICRALEACQKYNIIHRDIKMDNIFVSDDGDFRLGDFGIARVLEKSSMEMSKKGTYNYMAPEIFKGQAYDSTVDIYSLGLVLYRLMNNSRLPFMPPYPENVGMSAGEQAFVRRMSGEKFPLPGQVKKGRLPEIAAKACAYQPQERYSSPVAMRQDLEAILYEENEVTDSDWIMVYQPEAAKGQKIKEPAEDKKTEILLAGKVPCRVCGAPIDEGETFCPKCGANQKEEPKKEEPKKEENRKPCKKCGELIGQDMTFCPKCGADQREEPEKEENRKPCKKCGALIGREDAVCPKCGADQRETAEIPAGELPWWKKWGKYIAGGACAALAVILIWGIAFGSKKADPGREALVSANGSGKAAGESAAENRTEAGSGKETGAGSEAGAQAEGGKEADAEGETGAQAEHGKEADVKQETKAHPESKSAVAKNGTGEQAESGESVVRRNGEGTQEGNGQETKAAASWEGNVMMAGGMGNEVLGSDISKYKIVTITFLDSLTGMPASAWDVSADGSGKVMAWVTGSNLYIGAEGGVEANENCNRLFYRYGNVTQIHLNGNFHTEHTKRMSNMFGFCSNLKTIDLSSMDTSQATDMSFMFSSSGLETLDASGFNTSQVTNMKSMFDGCGSLAQLNVSGFDTSQVTDMKSMFCGCGSLTRLDLNNFDTSQVTDMSQMFSGSGSLAQLDLSSFDTSQVTKMDYMFSRCGSLTKLDLSGFDTSQVTKMDYMFENCRSLAQLDVSGFDTSQVIDMCSMFFDCRSLTQLDVSSFNTSQVMDISGMFRSCKNLKALDLSGFDTSRVTGMQYMFDGCENLETLDLSGFDTSQVTDMQLMFMICENLETLDLSGFDTSQVTDVHYMFYGCDKLKYLDISGFDMSQVTNAQKMFYDCRSLETLNGTPTFPDGADTFGMYDLCPIKP